MVPGYVDHIVCNGEVGVMIRQSNGDPISCVRVMGDTLMQTPWEPVVGKPCRVGSVPGVVLGVSSGYVWVNVNNCGPCTYGRHVVQEP